MELGHPARECTELAAGSDGKGKSKLKRKGKGGAWQADEEEEYWGWERPEEEAPSKKPRTLGQCIPEVLPIGKLAHGEVRSVCDVNQG